MNGKFEVPAWIVILLYCGMSYLGAFLTNQLVLMATNDDTFYQSMTEFQWIIVHLGCLLQVMFILKSMIKAGSKKRIIDDVDPITKPPAKDGGVNV